ncbi:MAG: hypothetical protein JWM12_1143 [Ilumatobacteraceae bacterium]|nr:hypothetical protein [Ilumatobacteraceae bacterium]
MRWLPRARSLLARHPMVWWAAVIVVAATTGVLAAGALHRLEVARRSWGARRAVWVAVAAATPGEPLVVEQRDYPVAVVPAGAVTASPAGSIAHERIGVGEIVVRSDVSTDGTTGLVPQGSLAIAVPVRSPPLQAGDRAAAFADGVRLGDGVVVAVTDEQVVLAIPADAAPELALAVAGNAVVLALLPAPA